MDEIERHLFGPYSRNIRPYFVLFSDPKLDKLKIKKQWVSSTNVLSTENVKDQLLYYLNQIEFRNSSDTMSMKELVALKLRMPFDVIVNEFGDIFEGRFTTDQTKDKQGGCRREISNFCICEES